MEPSYLSLSDADWQARLDAFRELERPCTICPRRCKVDRREAHGFCRSGETLLISSLNLHYGEEPPISGDKGSGTVFLTNCNLACRFCQNYPISQLGNGSEMSEEQLGKAMVGLQKRGAHNINFVSPMHYSAAIARSIRHAVSFGLRIPIVWNSNGYESLDTLRLLDGIVDIYMPDLKYSDDKNASYLSKAKDYCETAKSAISEMHRQVGLLNFDDNGIAYRGLLLRHLVLPENLAGSKEVLRFVAEEISVETFISLMSQYFPAHQASLTKGIDRRILREEYEEALQWLDEFGLENGFVQES